VSAILAIVAGVLLGLSVVIAVTNFYLSWLRYPLYRLLGGSRAEYRFVSGLPMVGSIAAFIALVLDNRTAFAWVALAALGVETGGLLWAVVWFPLALILDRRRPQEDKPNEQAHREP
jgi:hypothetical protein